MSTEGSSARPDPFALSPDELAELRAASAVDPSEQPPLSAGAPSRSRDPELLSLAHQAPKVREFLELAARTHLAGALSVVLLSPQELITSPAVLTADLAGRDIELLVIWPDDTVLGPHGGPSLDSGEDAALWAFTQACYQELDSEVCIEHLLNDERLAGALSSSWLTDALTAPVLSGCDPAALVSSARPAPARASASSAIVRDAPLSARAARAAALATAQLASARDALGLAQGAGTALLLGGFALNAAAETLAASAGLPETLSPADRLAALSHVLAPALMPALAPAAALLGHHERLLDDMLVADLDSVAAMLEAAAPLVAAALALASGSSASVLR